jgi:hypothetical protein
MRYFILITAIAFLAACGSGKNSASAGDTAAASGQALVVVNGDFEQAAHDHNVPGWSITQHAGPASYTSGIDSDGAFKGYGSFRITRTHEQVYGSIVQDVAVAKFAGKTIELSAMMKSENVGPRGWKLFVNAPGKQVYSQGLTGTIAWKREAVKLELPANARTITIGASLLDGGTGWLDEVELRVLD